jgi:inhibitor of KinA
MNLTMPDPIAANRQTSEPPRFLPAGDTALCVEFGDTIDRGVSARVLELARRLEATSLPGVVDLVPTFRSLLIHYDPVALSQAQLISQLEPLLGGLDATEVPGRRWHLPACYDPSLALDLEDVARRTGLSPNEVVRRHSAMTYHVYVVGFLPGFPYLGDLPAELALPRRENPRTKVPAGSIAIATSLSSVYALESPGGWHVVGRTPVRLWDMRRASPVLLRAGDKVVFQPVSLGEYEELAQKAELGELRIEPQPELQSEPRA